MEKRVPHERTARLQKLMRKHRLTVDEAALLIAARPTTVRAWVEEKKIIPEKMLALIEKRSAEGMPEKHPRTTELFKIMADNNLSAEVVGALVGRTEQTVRIWRNGTKVIPEHTLAVLKMKVAAGDHRRAPGEAA